MKRQLLIAMTLLSAAVAFGQSLYTPVQSAKDQGITLKAWGSGTITETDETAFEGVNSIRVSTRNYFQGGMIALGSPVNLTTAFGDKNNMLRFAIRVADTSMTLGGPGGKGGGNLAGPGGAAGPGGKGGGTRGGGQGGELGGGMTPPGGGSSQAAAVLQNLRVILATTDGKKSEVYLPINTSGAGERGWRLVAIPLQAISGLADSNKAITGIGISGDATSTFYIGEVRVINDSTPISGDTNYHDLNLALGDEVEFVGHGFGGASVLRYLWDFSAADGIQVDAEGQAVKRKFRRDGKYTVTLTIVDVFGLKKPYSATVYVTVNP